MGTNQRVSGSSVLVVKLHFIVRNSSSILQRTLGKLVLLCSPTYNDGAYKLLFTKHGYVNHVNDKRIWPRWALIVKKVQIQWLHCLKIQQVKWRIERTTETSQYN